MGAEQESGAVMSPSSDCPGRDTSRLLSLAVPFSLWLILCSLLPLAFLGSIRPLHTFLSRPQKTAKALHCVDHNKLTSFQLQPHAPHLLNRSPEAQIVRRRRSKPGAISFFLGLLGSSSGLLLGADICGGEDAQETFCPRNLPASRRERTG